MSDYRNVNAIENFLPECIFSSEDVPFQNTTKIETSATLIIKYQKNNGFFLEQTSNHLQKKKKKKKWKKQSNIAQFKRKTIFFKSKTQKNVNDKRCISKEQKKKNRQTLFSISKKNKKEFDHYQKSMSKSREIKNRGDKVRREYVHNLIQTIIKNSINYNFASKCKHKHKHKHKKLQKKFEKQTKNNQKKELPRRKNTRSYSSPNIQRGIRQNKITMKVGCDNNKKTDSYTNINETMNKKTARNTNNTASSRATNTTSLNTNNTTALNIVTNKDKNNVKKNWFSSLTTSSLESFEKLEQTEKTKKPKKPTFPDPLIHFSHRYQFCLENSSHYGNEKKQIFLKIQNLKQNRLQSNRKFSLKGLNFQQSSYIDLQSDEIVSIHEIPFKVLDTFNSFSNTFVLDSLAIGFIHLSEKNQNNNYINQGSSDNNKNQKNKNKNKNKNKSNQKNKSKGKGEEKARKKSKKKQKKNNKESKSNKKITNSLKLKTKRSSSSQFPKQQRGQLQRQDLGQIKRNNINDNSQFDQNQIRSFEQRRTREMFLNNKNNYEICSGLDHRKKLDKYYQNSDQLSKEDIVHDLRFHLTNNPNSNEDSMDFTSCVNDHSFKNRKIMDFQSKRNNSEEKDAQVNQTNNNIYNPNNINHKNNIENKSNEKDSFIFVDTPSSGLTYEEEKSKHKNSNNNNDIKGKQFFRWKKNKKSNSLDSNLKKKYSNSIGYKGQDPEIFEDLENTGLVKTIDLQLLYFNNFRNCNERNHNKTYYRVKSGKLPSLISELLFGIGSIQSSYFLKGTVSYRFAFFLSYRSIVSSLSELLSMIINQYALRAPILISQEQRKYWKLYLLPKKKLKILDCLLYWIKIFPYHFQSNMKFRKSFYYFISQEKDNNEIEIRKKCSEILMYLQLFESNENITYFKQIWIGDLSKLFKKNVNNGSNYTGNSGVNSGGGGSNIGGNPNMGDLKNKKKNEKNKELDRGKNLESIPTPIFNKKKSLTNGRLDFIKINSLEFARQLNILDFQLFQKIHPNELLNLNWNKGSTLKEREANAPNVHKFIQRFNQTALLISTQILRHSVTEKRAKVVKKCIKIAQNCYNLKNINSMMAILAGLDAPSIHRLKKTWRLVSQKDLNKLQSLKKVVDNKKNFVVIRKMMAKGKCIPYLGMLLSDLTFIYDGMPKVLKNDHINFQRYRKISKIVFDICKLQVQEFNFHEIPFIQKFLLYQNNWSDNDSLYKLSLKIEPRN
ncbi:guanine nucleotide exchange factor [Anaeramoeba flamelloides]|uniref:Guanine nucleotide exchange factor n=1 Tax=Anaeramoeba flamelloides TaxID=1746091 RepID=A0ABQ8XAK4_9EUKA|nr:guanine nucleotide exchange factor [Anaeramoeba flamelloides]